MTLFINYTGNNLSITFCTVCNPCLFSSLHLSLIRYGIFFQTKLLSRLSPRFCRFLSSHFRPKGSQICIFIYNTRQISWNTCVYFPQCFKIRLTQHWGGRTHISGGETVWRINLKIFPENSRETVSVSTICDEYCRMLSPTLSCLESYYQYCFLSGPHEHLCWSTRRHMAKVVDLARGTRMDSWVGFIGGISTLFGDFVAFVASLKVSFLCFFPSLKLDFHTTGHNAKLGF